jgi:hypothetical protein
MTTQLEADCRREWLWCPECKQWVRTVAAEGVPAQALRACKECDAVFWLDLNATPIYKKPRRQGP